MFNFQKIMTISICFFTFNLAYAETCPTPAQVKTFIFQKKGWKVFDLDNGEVLDKERLQEFQQNVQTFAKAVWLKDAPEGEAECFYNGNGYDEYLGAYLAKPLLVADNSSGSWRVIDDIVSECDRSLDRCAFKHRL